MKWYWLALIVVIVIIIIALYRRNQKWKPYEEYINNCTKSKGCDFKTSSAISYSDLDMCNSVYDQCKIEADKKFKGILT